MDMNRERLLREIMAVDLALVDMNLYLDTHPFDQKAIGIYNNVVQRSKMMRSNYERMYGPLNPLTMSRYPWQWIEGPWPWEKR